MPELALARGPAREEVDQRADPPRQDDHQDPDDLLVALVLLVLRAVDDRPDPQAQERDEEAAGEEPERQEEQEERAFAAVVEEREHHAASVSVRRLLQELEGTLQPARGLGEAARAIAEEPQAPALAEQRRERLPQRAARGDRHGGRWGARGSFEPRAPEAAGKGQEIRREAHLGDDDRGVGQRARRAVEARADLEDPRERALEPLDPEARHPRVRQRLVGEREQEEERGAVRARGACLEIDVAEVDRGAAEHAARVAEDVRVEEGRQVARALARRGGVPGAAGGEQRPRRAREGRLQVPAVAPVRHEPAARSRLEAVPRGAREIRDGVRRPAGDALPARSPRTDAELEATLRERARLPLERMVGLVAPQERDR